MKGKQMEAEGNRERRINFFRETGLKAVSFCNSIIKIRMTKRQKVITGIVFILAGLIMNQWLLVLVRPKFAEVNFPIHLWIFQIFMISTGFAVVFISAFRIFVKFLFIEISVLLYLFLMCVCAEAYLSFTKWVPPKKNVPEILMQYKGVINLKAHPLFFAFFDDKALNMKNEVVSIDGRGFRGTLPEEAGNKKLAFLSGGSTAFGWGTLGDSTTITGFLNKFQNEYLFVNAAAPGQNSTQEYLRLSFDLLRYKPELIVFLNGYNDLALSYTYAFEKKNYALGTPAIFMKIDDMVNKNIFPEKEKKKPVRKIFRLSLLKRYLDYILIEKDPNYSCRKSTAVVNFDRLEIPPDNGLQKKDKIEVPDNVAAIADRYIENINLIRTICAKYNIKPVIIFQPNLCVHKTISDEDKLRFPKDRIRLKKEFFLYSLQSQYLITKKAPFIYDFGNIFDKYSKVFPVKDIFYDTCHFTDTGNKIVAEEIIQVLKKEKLLKQ